MSKEFPDVNTVITDASCFILLDKIGCIWILEALYQHVITTPEIAEEYGKQLPNWVFIQEVRNRNLMHSYSEKVDIGEASAIALAFEVPSPMLIIDDLKGRKLADELRLKYTGTIGILVKAKETGALPLFKPYFDKIKAADFRLPSFFLDALLKKYEA